MPTLVTIRFPKHRRDAHGRTNRMAPERYARLTAERYGWVGVRVLLVASYATHHTVRLEHD